MNIPEQIDSIIEQRQKRLPQIEKMQKRLYEVNETINRLDKVCYEATLENSQEYGVLFAHHPEIAEKLKYINTKSFHNSYLDVKEIVDRLYNRFSRQHVHISFVGRAGQGKSLVMQKISGLSSDIIPSSDGADCTGAKSIITNSDTNNVEAEITFYSRDEYKDIVNKYLAEIFGDGKYIIHSVEDISKLNIQELQAQLLPQAQASALFLQLRKYIEHSDECISFLGTKKRINVDEIESYVAQYDKKDFAKKYYKYLGVKVANIFCPFPCENCGKIILVDTIGMGDTALNIREKMLETVSNDSDAIVLMTRPDPKRPTVSRNDIDIITDIGNKVTEAYTQKMLFWVINKVSSGNGKNIEGIPGILNVLQGMKNFPVAGFLEVDCSNQAEVEDNLLTPILKQLSGNLPQMDTILIDSVQEQLDDLYQEYHKIVNKAKLAFTASVDQDIRREFGITIDRTYQKMTNAIRNLYLNDPYGKLRNEPCKRFEEAAKKKMKKILKHIPSRDEVVELLNNGTVNQHNVYEYVTDNMRLFIINDFLELNEILHELVVDMKKDIIGILASEEYGKLGELITISTDDPDKWLKEFIEILKEYPKYDLITEAIEKLADFDLRMEGFLIYRVRDQLDVIDLSLILQGPEIHGSLKEKDVLADDIIFWIKHNLEIVYKNIQKELSPLFSFPNNALWAVIKDFYDRIVYNRKSGITVKTSWRYLYEDSISKIWKQEYNSYQMQKGMTEEWNILIGDINKFDNKDMFRFIN